MNEHEAATKQMKLGIIAFAIFMASFVAMAGSPDLVDGVIYWLSNGAYVVKQ